MLPFVAVDETKIAPLQPFGVCVAVAFFAWDHVLMRLGARRGFDRSDFRALTVWLGLLGWAFAWGVDAVFYGRSTGFSSTGAILGATVGGVLWCRIAVGRVDGRWQVARRASPHPLLPVSDVIVGTWPLAHAIGRLGCALVHDHIGKSVAPGTLGSLVAVGFPRAASDGSDHVLGPFHVVLGGSDVRYDLGLLEMIFLAGLALGFARTWRRPLAIGTYTMIGSLAYGSFRFLLDFLRAGTAPNEPATGEPRLAGLTFAQYWSLAVVALGVTLLMRRRRGLVGAVICAMVVFHASPSQAAERYIDRPMTLRQHVFAGNVGIGVAHHDFLRGNETGSGLNLEGAFAVTESVELGLRTGARFGDAGRFNQADSAGRTIWTETYGTGADTFANPEFRVRWAFYAGSVAEVGLDGRLYIPFETGTRPGFMFGVPLAFHVSDFLRIDTGAYIPLVFTRPTFNGLSIPGYFWFQPSERLWLGPLTALRFLGAGDGSHAAHLLLGFGLGYQVANSVDLKTMFLFPAFDDNPSRSFAAGFGVEFRIGD